MEKRSVTGYCAGADGRSMKKFHELDIPHSGFYAEGAGATFFGEYKKEELYKVVSFGERHGFKVFSWQLPNMTQELAQELLPECPKEELPITRNENDEGRKTSGLYRLLSSACERTSGSTVEGSSGCRYSWKYG